jgi:hypothetical protein
MSASRPLRFGPNREEFLELRRILTSSRFDRALKELATRRVTSALGLEAPSDPYDTSYRHSTSRWISLVVLSSTPKHG